MSNWDGRSGTGFSDFEEDEDILEHRRQREAIRLEQAPARARAQAKADKKLEEQWAQYYGQGGADGIFARASYLPEDIYQDWDWRNQRINDWISCQVAEAIINGPIDVRQIYTNELVKEFFIKQGLHKRKRKRGMVQQTTENRTDSRRFGLERWNGPALWRYLWECERIEELRQTASPSEQLEITAILNMGRSEAQQVAEQRRKRKEGRDPLPKYLSYSERKNRTLEAERRRNNFLVCVDNNGNGHQRQDNCTRKGENNPLAPQHIQQVNPQQQYQQQEQQHLQLANIANVPSGLPPVQPQQYFHPSGAPCILPPPQEPLVPITNEPLQFLYDQQQQQQSFYLGEPQLLLQPQLPNINQPLGLPSHPWNAPPGQPPQHLLPNVNQSQIWPPPVQQQQQQQPLPSIQRRPGLPQPQPQQQPLATRSNETMLHQWQRHESLHQPAAAQQSVLGIEAQPETHLPAPIPDEQRVCPVLRPGEEEHRRDRQIIEEFCNQMARSDLNRNVSRLTGQPLFHNSRPFQPLQLSPPRQHNEVWIQEGIYSRGSVQIDPQAIVYHFQANPTEPHVTITVPIDGPPPNTFRYAPPYPQLPYQPRAHYIDYRCILPENNHDCGVITCQLYNGVMQRHTSSGQVEFHQVAIVHYLNILDKELKDIEMPSLNQFVKPNEFNYIDLPTLYFHNTAPLPTNSGPWGPAPLSMAPPASHPSLDRRGAWDEASSSPPAIIDPSYQFRCNQYFTDHIFTETSVNNLNDLLKAIEIVNHEAKMNNFNNKS